MSRATVDLERSSPSNRFTQNIVAEAITIVLVILFGILSSILIVRGLPQTPVYEFYLFILVFTWVNMLIPLGAMGMDVALRRHVPEVVSTQSSMLTRNIGVAVLTTIVTSLSIVAVMYVLVAILPQDFFVPSYAVPFLQLALWTIILTAASTVMQGAFRGMQEMRYCTFAMGLFHGAYVAGLVVLFLTGTMTLLTVIIANFAASGLTIAYEAGVLQRLLRSYRSDSKGEARVTSIRSMTSTASQGLALALLGAVLVYVPILIANQHRTSDVVLAGLGLALSVAVWIQQGLSAPFRVLMPRAAGDAAQRAWTTIKGYMSRAWKLGVLLAAFVTVISVFFAAPVLIVMFATEGLVALPFFVLMTGGFLIYPLVVMFSDTLIGLGRIRSVLATNAVWTVVVLMVLWFLTPIWREVVVALIWLVVIPFFVVFIILYQRRTESRVEFGFLPKTLGVLAIVALGAFGILWSGSVAITVWGLAGIVSWLFQIGLILTAVPLAIVYLWMLIRGRVLDAGDTFALLRMSEELHPVSRPVSWLVERMSRHDEPSP
ncbi:MAG: lipopolysaccharide biosynthesis protein [Promethearchaeota archaeon]